MSYLEGHCVLADLDTPAGRQGLVGRRVVYLQAGDIDRSGRGYYFPRVGIVSAFHRQEIAMDHPYNFIVNRRALVEMVLAPTQPAQ